LSHKVQSENTRHSVTVPVI